ncbi:MAG: putative monovalent cation/H+ antiporter subunit A [Candidatus Kapaibacterium sp.]
MLSAVVYSGFILAIFVPLIFRIFGKKSSGAIISLLPLGIFLYLLTYLPEVNSGNYIKETTVWFSSLGVNLSFYLDGLSLIFALIISGIGFAVFSYAGKYMEHNPFIERFYVYISIFMASMLGVVISDNVFALFIFWELTSISSYLLIGFNHHTEKSRYSALQAMLITAMGGLAMLAGLLLLSLATGTQSIQEMKVMSAMIISHDYYLPALILILLGAFTKSAQFPFHFWLPNAMEAPTPVSAYLHSATMVKAGVFLLARLSPVLSAGPYWTEIVTGIGAVTMLGGAVMSVYNTDLKRILAYSTVSVLGTLTMLIGLGTEFAIKGMVIYLLAHSLYKGALFLYAGIIDHETGTRDIREIAGLSKFMPITLAIGFLAAFSKMGLVPFFGFIGKETVYDAALRYDHFGYAIIAFTVSASIFIVAAAALVGIKPFLGKEAKYPGNKPHEAPFQMLLGPALLAAAGFLFGIFPLIVEGLLGATVSDITGIPVEFHLSLWHGFNVVLLLSIATLGIGAFLYFYIDKLREMMKSFWKPEAVFPENIYKFSLDGMMKTAKGQTRLLQNGYLRYYITFIILTTIGLVGYSLVNFNDLSMISPDLGIEFHELMIALIVIASAITAVMAKGRLTAVAAMGVVGFSVAFIFILYGAPDLAMTQFAIETLTVIVFVYVIYRLPKYINYSKNSRRVKDGILASATGLMMASIILIVSETSKRGDIKEYYNATSYLKAKGRNIVNVILVDFRALDTMGEITVLAVAALGVFALLKLRNDGREDFE